MRHGGESKQTGSISTTSQSLPFCAASQGSASVSASLRGNPAKL